MDIVDWAKRLIATPSVSRDGNAEVADLAAELLTEAGARPEIICVHHDGVAHFAVVADLGPLPSEHTEGLLLVTHLDTVPPGPAELWTETGGDPFRPTIKGDALYGLGSADVKGDFACKAAALAELADTRLDRPVRIVGTFAEEIGLVGARWLAAEGLTQGFAAALVGEPSELACIRAHKGYSVWEAEIALERIGEARGRIESTTLEGASAHSSTPHLGKNAIEAALARLAEPGVAGVIALEGGGAANQVPSRCELAFATASDDALAAAVYDAAPLVAFHAAWRERLAELAKTTDADFDPDHTVGNLGRVTLEDGRARFVFDLRPIPGTTPREAAEPLGEHATLRAVRENPALATPEDSRVVRAVRAAQRAAGLAERVTTKATCTEAGLLAATGLDAIVIGPGRSVGNVHRPNEHTSLAQLARARELYVHAIRSLCVAEDA